MPFTIQLMYNQEPMNKITKTPITQGGFTVTGTLRDGCSIVNPEVIIECNNPITQNYAYIEVFRRYYYINDIQAFRSYQDQQNNLHNLWVLKLHCDVLKTFAEGILGSPCVIVKTASNEFNLYLPDPNFKCKQNNLVGFKSFPPSFSEISPKFYLTFFG